LIAGKLFIKNKLLYANSFCFCL